MSGRRQQSGFTMIEVLVTIAILVVGLLGLAAMQTLSTLAELESYQRSQALVLVRDMADRMSANKAQITSYVANDLGLAPMDCNPYIPIPPTPGDFKLDICEWNNQLNGSAEQSGAAKNVGAMIGARGCIVRLDPVTFLVTVAWQGLSRAGVPKEACGAGKYDAADETRRTVSMVVRVGLLNAP